MTTTQGEIVQRVTYDDLQRRLAAWGIFEAPQAHPSIRHLVHEESGVFYSLLAMRGSSFIQPPTIRHMLKTFRKDELDWATALEPVYMTPFPSRQLKSIGISGEDCSFELTANMILEAVRTGLPDADTLPDHPSVRVIRFRDMLLYVVIGTQEDVDRNLRTDITVASEHAGSVSYFLIGAVKKAHSKPSSEQRR